jgi:hypothetical protein
MAARRIKPTLALKISTLDTSEESLNEQYPKHSDIIKSLKHMDLPQVENIYSSISEHFLQNMVYYELFTYEERLFIYVVSIDVDGVTTPVNMGFYKSTGTSRGTGLNNIWLPTLSMAPYGPIIKAEDPYLLKYGIKGGVRNIDEEEQLITYKRFINKQYALVSFFLSHYPDLKVDKIITYADVRDVVSKHNEMFKRDSSYDDKLFYNEYINSQKLVPKSIKGQMPI